MADKDDDGARPGSRGDAEGGAAARDAANRDAAMRARLDQLGGALEARRAASPKGDASARGGSGGDSGGAMAKGLRAASELVAGILVGGFIGWELDSWLGTKPWLSIVFFLLGVAAGFWNVMRVALAPTGGSPPKGD